MKFIFIAVNYNGAGHTANYLQSLQEMNLPHGDTLEAIIVDNCSASADLANVQKSIEMYSFAKLIALDHNPGYFSGLNVGLESCLKDKGVLFIVGNNDLKFAVDFIEKLKEIPYEDKVMVIAPNITTLSGRRQNPHVIYRVTILERFKARIYMSNYYVAQFGHLINSMLRTLVRKFRPISAERELGPAHGRMNIKRGIGACYILTPHFFEHYNLLDNRVFLWGEEALLSNQVESAGGLTLYDPFVNVLHCESASVRFIQNRKRYEIVKESYKIYRRYL